MIYRLVERRIYSDHLRLPKLTTLNDGSYNTLMGNTVLRANHVIAVLMETGVTQHFAGLGLK